MAHDFAAARGLAQHCPELVVRGPRPEERAALITSWRRDLARHWGERLGALFTGDRVTAAVSAPEWLKGSAVLERLGPVAANSLLRCGAPDSAAVLFSLDHATALALAERSFGGAGRVGAPNCDPLPRSALLLSDAIASQTAAALVAARAGDDAVRSGGDLRAEVMLRSENAARLRPFDPGADCALIVLQLTSDQGCEWTALLACTAERFAALLPDQAGVRAAAPGAAGADGGAAAASFGAIPLGLCAVLAELELTLAQLDRLAPGDTIPLAMPRQVPLRIGDALVGHGSIGTLDNRLALRLTQLAAQVPAQGLLP